MAQRKFGGASTGEEVTAGVGLGGRVVVVTGANAGIGFETARVFALRGATVVLGCRSKDRGEDAVRRIRERHPSSNVRFMALDLASQASVRSFAASFLRDLGGRCDVLVCNAAVFLLPEGYTETAEGIELTVGVHVGHFLLANLLLPALQASAPSRVVVVSSESHGYPVFDLAVPEELPAVERDGSGRVTRVGPVKHAEGWRARWETTFPLHRANYNHQWAYSQAKLADVLFAREFSRRYGGSDGRGVVAVSLHPGNMIQTEITRHSLFYRTLFWLVSPLTKTLEQGAATTLYCATSPDIEAGVYYNNCAPGRTAKGGLDDAMAARLWRWCEVVTGLGGTS